jgi:hypothetical protein
MEHYAGIDVSLELSSVCVVDATGRIVREEGAHQLFENQQERCDRTFYAPSLTVSFSHSPTAVVAADSTDTWAAS